FTFQAWLLLVVRSLPVPLIMLFLGWRVRATSNSDFDNALAGSLISAGAVLYLFIFERKLCRKEGVAEVHFDWNTNALALFRRHLGWLAMLLVPCIFVVKFYSANGIDSAHVNSLGRLAFIVQSLGLVVFAHIALRPSSKALESLKEKYLGIWIEKLGGLWYLTVVGIPLTFAGLAFYGYYFTALELSNAALRSIIVLLIIMQANALVSRWFFLLSRRMAIKRAKVRRRSAALPQLSEAEIEADKLTASDIKTLRQETRSLRRIAFLIVFVLWLYWIWSPILPALRFFDTVQLWSFANAEGGEAWVTLGSLLKAFGIIIATIIAIRTIPAVIEATILRRFNVDRGGRYAVKAVTRYLFTLIGFLMAFGALGVHWEDVQWLVAGLSVGLGFGLQEIFANFVSGLIMFFERPVRVGDTVTVGDVNGTVTRINMRATTVLDWERKELVVPNKMFVTDRLINWSLSDDVVRVKAEVGVAYGSDVRLVEKVLYEIAKDVDTVVTDPKPVVVFMAFGDSTLNFELRCFVHGVDNWTAARNKINFEIDKRFREHGIEIAFPQRVLHFSKGANELLLGRNSGNASGEAQA
ncbi:MAG: mechanosensitive ion channel, partial [Planctomycetes bacterium]|nr:mechanosensitive ion channel [Planctomycetota bacterium]